MIRFFLDIIRWPNLFLVAIIQGLVYRILLKTAASVMSFTDLALLTGITILLAASGYVINDYYDTRTDAINRPHRRIAGVAWSLRTVRQVYMAIVLTGALLSIYCGWRLGLLHFLFLYPLAAAGLWLYSYAFKCRPVIGNLWVSLFGAGMVVIVALPDWLEQNREVIRPELWWFALFAFLSTWYREIVKDLEDAAGDSAAGCNTFVVLYGLQGGKIMAVILGVFLAAALFWWDANQVSKTVTFMLLILQGAVVGSMALIWWARDREYFRTASWMIKGIMLGGTLTLLFL